MSRRILGRWLDGLIWCLTWPATAQAAPVAVVAAVLHVAAASFVAIAATFVVNTAISIGLSYVANKLFGPKAPSGGAATAQERQASITTLGVGEQPREVIFGKAANGGTLAGAFNYGGANGTDWVVKVVIVADHRCDALVGFYVNDLFVTWSADGAVAGYNSQLEVYWRDGQAAQAFPSALMTAWRASPLHADLAPTSDTPYVGQAYVVFAYKADAPDAQSPTWAGAHPQFLPVIKGKRCYDPRKDSTVGGSGAHRWATPSTWEWTDNLSVCRYNWVRGVYALDDVGTPAKLLIGRGLSAIEAPPANVFAYANLCDETVDDGKGGTEKRYTANGVIRATEQYLAVEQMFAAASAGRIIQPQGGVEVEPGEAKSPVFFITDDDLVQGRQLTFNAFGSDADRVNTVIPRYVEPTQHYADTAGTVQRDLTQVALDGPRELTLPLALVTSPGQAQRVSKIVLAEKLLERTATVPVMPEFSEAEEGDWIVFTSARHTANAPVIFRISAFAADQGWVNTWSLEETSTEAFGGAVEPLEDIPGFEPAGTPGALTLTGVAITAASIDADDGAVHPAIKASWTAPVDPGIRGVRLEVRKVGTTDVSVAISFEPNTGTMLTTNGVASATGMEGRVAPLGVGGRPFTPSAWIPLDTDPQVTPGTGGTANLVPNGGLTLGTNLWTVDSWGWGRDGIVGVFFQCLANGTHLAESGEFVAVAAKPYTMSLFGGTSGAPSAGDVYMDVEWFNSSHAHLAYSSRVALPHLTPGSNYERVILSVTAPSSTAFARARIYTESVTYSGGGFSVITQVKVEQSAAFSGFNDLATSGALYGDGTYIDALKPLDVGATKNTVFRSSSTPTALSTGDFWVVLSGTTPIALRQWNGTAWVTPADATGQNTALAILGQQAWATAKVSYQSSAPASPTTGDIWIDTSTTPKATKRWDGSAWQIVGRATDNTNQLTDGASLGVTASWPSVTGTGRPADNADVTSTHVSSGFTGQGNFATGNYYRQSSTPSSPALYSIWIDTSGAYEVIKIWNGSAWITAANNNTATGDAAFYLTGNTNLCGSSHFGATTQTTNTVTLTPHGNTGSVSYQWTNPRDGVAATAPTGATTAFTGFVGVGQELEGTSVCIATDAGSGQTAAYAVSIDMAETT